MKSAVRHTNDIIRKATAEALKQHPIPSNIPRYALENLMADEDGKASKAAKEVFAALYPKDAANAGIK